MKRVVSIIFGVIVLCISSLVLAQQSVYTGALMTLNEKGDTLVIERFLVAPGKLEAEVINLGENPTYSFFDMNTDIYGMMLGFNMEVHNLNAKDTIPLLRKESIVLQGAQRSITIAVGELSRTISVPGHTGTLPYIDLVYWPLELMLSKMKLTGERQSRQDMFTGARSLIIEVSITEEGIAIIDPIWGQSIAQVDNDGHLVSIDASGSSRPITVTQIDWPDFGGILEGFPARIEESLPSSVFNQVNYSANVLASAIKLSYNRTSFDSTGWNVSMVIERKMNIGGVDLEPGSYDLNINTADGSLGITKDGTEIGNVPMVKENFANSVEAPSATLAKVGDSGQLLVVFGNAGFKVRFEVL